MSPSTRSPSSSRHHNRMASTISSLSSSSNSWPIAANEGIADAVVAIGVETDLHHDLAMGQSQRELVEGLRTHGRHVNLPATSNTSPSPTTRARLASRFDKWCGEIPHAAVNGLRERSPDLAWSGVLAECARPRSGSRYEHGGASSPGPDGDASPSDSLWVPCALLALAQLVARPLTPGKVVGFESGRAHVRLADVVTELERWFPPNLAEPDSVGLTFGDPDAAVESVSAGGRSDRGIAAEPSSAGSI